MNVVRRCPRSVLALTTLLAITASVGVAGAASPSLPAASTPKCQHPYPCGYRWAGLPAPYQVRPTERLSVTTFDGVKLNGFVLRPELPAGATVPVILTSTPYMEQGTVPTGFYVGGIPGRQFAELGYAVVAFSVRGTGDSGGCFGLKSVAEQNDLPVVIDWLSKQSWSNGRVGMQGLSYPGTTPIMAAIQNPPALKTIVVAGTILDEYTFDYSPQGAATLPAAFTLAGPAPGITEPYSIGPGAKSDPTLLSQRVCPDVVEANTVFPAAEVTGERSPQYWTDRRFIDRVPGITAATFVVHGFQDRWGSGHAFQASWAWQALTSAPKRMLYGQWWHEWPNHNSIYPSMIVPDWQSQLVAWFDYWLKGIGDSAPGLGQVQFQDSSGAWNTTDAWPAPLVTKKSSTGPARRHDEVVYLREQKMSPTAGPEKATFASVLPPWTGGTNPDLTGAGGPDGNSWRWSTPCPDPSRLVYSSDPVQSRTLLAGNPLAWLNVESSAPGGVFELQLYDVGPGFDCTKQPTLNDDLRPLTEGSADLRYYASTDYKAHPFAPLTPTSLRVDLANLAEVLEPGHRLALVVNHGFWHGTTPEMFPLLTLHGDGSAGSSHLVLPVVSGGLGGQAPTVIYPPRPFLPSCCTDPNPRTR